MTPEELAERHPKLYHVTEPGAWLSIQRYGLLSTSHLLELFEMDNKITTQRRKEAILIEHPLYGRVVLNDQVPLLQNALEKCLDDNLKPEDWIKTLNARVFFWASEKNLDNHLSARLNKTRPREVLVLDTLSLAKAHAERIEICPINSGVTFRKAARRGIHTFTPMLRHPYHEWSKLRGGKDKIQEVTVLDCVKDIEKHVLEVIQANKD